MPVHRNSRLVLVLVAGLGVCVEKSFLVENFVGCPTVTVVAVRPLLSARLRRVSPLNVSVAPLLPFAGWLSAWRAASVFAKTEGWNNLSLSPLSRSEMVVAAFLLLLRALRG